MARPKAAKLSLEELEKRGARLGQELLRSPVLEALGVQVKTRRGRFHLERPRAETGDKVGGEIEVEVLGRITPLAGTRIELLLEVEYRSWSEVAKGGPEKVMNAVAGDKLGRFHGPGELDRGLRERDPERRPLVERNGQLQYASGGEVGVHEVLYHGLGLPIPVIAEPREWYRYHRTPVLREWVLERGLALVDFTAMSWSGESFGGTCLYSALPGQVGAFPVKPSQAGTLASAEAWLAARGRGWRA